MNEVQKIADLYCCQGGASEGLHQAFPDAEITGFDVEPQRRYPFRFVQQDALTVDLSDFDLVWASPPCQAYSSMKALPNVKTAHPELIEPTRELLVRSRKPYIMENVVGAPLRNFITLCGSMFNLRSTGRRYLKRHRLFETSWSVAGLLPPHNHSGLAVSIVGHGSAGQGMRIRTANAAEAKVLLGVDWMTRDGMSQCIPPAYARWLGEQFQLTSHYGGSSVD